MPNYQTLLTDAICHVVMAEHREFALRDSRQRNLSLRVRPCGAKTWVVRLRRNGIATRASIGSYPDMGVKKARVAASAVLAGETVTPQPMLLFGAFCAEHESRYAQSLKASGLRTYRVYVRTQLLPAFGKKPLSTLARVDVVRWFERYSATSPGGANRALGILGQMLGCAKRWGRLPADWSNPVTGIRHNRRRAIGTFLSKQQMARLGAVLATRCNNGCTASALLTALLLTGCRVGEMLELYWSDIGADRLRLRDSKTGARDVPLGSAARHFLTAHQRKNGLRPGADARVFAISARDRYERVRMVWRSVRAESGMPNTLRIHDLRHSFASHAIMAGESLFTVSRLLGHRRIQTTARYAHLADGAMLQGAERIGALIMKQALPPPRRGTLARSSDTLEANHV